MTSISNNGFILLARGDTFRAPLFINWGSKSCPVRYYIKNHPKDTVYLGIMEVHQPFEEAIIKKMYTSDTAEINECGDIIVKLKSTDTECLLPGKYYYEVKLVSDNDDVDTIIPKTEFFILS